VRQGSLFIRRPLTISAITVFGSSRPNFSSLPTQSKMVIRKPKYFSPPGVFCRLNVSVYPAINKTMFSILHDADFVRPELAAKAITSGRLKSRRPVWQYGDRWNICYWDIDS